MIRIKVSDYIHVIEDEVAEADNSFLIGDPEGGREYIIVEYDEIPKLIEALQEVMRTYKPN